jgi:hypothetical protein
VIACSPPAAYYFYSLLFHSTESRMMMNRLVALALLALAGAANAAPVPITGLYNTGVDASLNVLPTGSVDPHYTLSPNPDPGNSPNALVLPLSNGWAPNDSTSAWIGPASSLVPNCYPCSVQSLFGYRLSFSLAGLDPATASILGSWAADDSGATIFLNGINTGIFYGAPAYGALASFAITSGFVAGLNTLSFVVSNSGEGPTGLLVRGLAGTADVLPVPIPAALWLLGSGLLGLIGIGRRRVRPTAA